MNLSFDEVYKQWITNQIEMEKNQRRRELLRKGLSHGTVTFLRAIWFPVIGNLNDLHAEYEVRDLDNKYRYLDLAFMPGGAKGCIEIQDYRSHARDIESGRFKDLCMKQAALVLDWTTGLSYRLPTYPFVMIQVSAKNWCFLLWGNFYR